MECFAPIRGYRGPGGRVSFSPTVGFYDKPLSVKCGQCINCRLERTRQWAVRIMHEAHTHEANSFITLTYSDDNLPADHSLNVEHWQKFAKRLRKRIGKFRYYHCGEYGEKTLRPHYHACIFGYDFTKDRTLHKTTHAGHHLYTSPTLDASWALGHALIGDLTFESASYVAGYVTKKVTGKNAEAHYQTIDTSTGLVSNRKPDYSTMSRRPGIGSEWFKKWKDQVYPRDEVIFQGHAMRPPSYYDNQYEIINPTTHLEVKAKRKQKALENAKDDSPQRLLTREKYAELQQQQFKREPNR